MDLHNNSHPEFGKLEQIVSQFLLKSLHIILHSRIPSLCPHDRNGDMSSISRVRKSDKWFNLILGDRPPALDNLNFWHRNLMDPMVIDVILVHEDQTSSVDDLYSSSVAGAPVETIIERWVVQYESPRVMPPQSKESSAHYKKTYKKSIVHLRSLYTQMRLLPAYRIFRQLSSSNQTYNLDIIYKVSSTADPFSRMEEKMLKGYNFAPVDAHPGRLNISMTYRPTLSEFNLKPLTTIAPTIITDYVGSPNTDPMRYFSSSRNGVRATSFSIREARPPSHPSFERPHSWTSGFHRAAAAAAQNQSHGGSSLVHHTYNYPSPTTDIHGQRVQNLRPISHQKAIIYDEYQLSPPFSPSPSPSPPTYLSGGIPAQTYLHPESAPVTIPFSLTARSSRNLSANFSDPNRCFLPPMSPRSTKHDNSSQESPSGIRSFRKMEGMNHAEVHLGVPNSYSGHKVVRDSRDDSGRFSGLLSSSGSPRIGFSRSSSRLSSQDDIDDCEFSCPFDVDDIDTSNSQVRNPDGQKALEFTPQSSPIGRKSQDAAVGVLVHMLRTAAPLRQDSSSYSTHSMKAGAEVDLGTASGYLMSRKTADALEELRSYREMKDLLLSKSGALVLSRDESKSAALVTSSHHPSHGSKDGLRGQSVTQVASSTNRNHV